MGRLRRIALPLCVLATAASCGATSAPPPAAAEMPREGGAEVAPPPPDAGSIARVEPGELAGVATAVGEIVAGALREKKMPGCVVVAGTRDRILFRRAFGARAVEPAAEPMTLDTVFDVASLTKPLVTAASVHLLADRGLLALDDAAAKHLPAFDVPGKRAITVRQLLLHTAGFPSVPPKGTFTQPTDASRKIAQIAAAAPGSRLRYSDLGYIALGELVEKKTGMSLDVFAKTQLFEPLGAKTMTYRPNADVVARVAPTERKDGAVLRGVVHDPIAAALGGVAGNAGVFSDAADLVRYARMLLGGGELEGKRVLASAVVHQLTTVHDVPGGLRTPGFDVRTSLSTNRAEPLSLRAFGHGGYTGTAIWIDPARDFFFVFLSNRVHPDGGRGAVAPFVAKIGTTLVEALDRERGRPSREGACRGPVVVGVDALALEPATRFAGKRVALLTNSGARAQNGETTFAALRRFLGPSLVMVLTPEHGFGADAEGKIGDGELDGVPVKSMYGARLSPDDETFAAFDVVVVDLPDVGLRYFTYAATMHRLLRAAAARGKEVVVLDRPNPLGGLAVDGPMDVPVGSFVQHHPLPLVHGLTMGELAYLLDAEEHLGTALDVVPVRGEHRGRFLDDLRLPWSAPSPNLTSFEALLSYAATALVEGTNVSVGRGTEEPFRVVAAPWLAPDAVLPVLRGLALEGVAFEGTTVTPAAGARFAAQTLPAVRLKIVDRSRYRPVRVGLAIALALHKAHAAAWDATKLAAMVGGKTATALLAGEPLAKLEAGYAAELAAFAKRRAKYPLYGSCDGASAASAGSGAAGGGGAPRTGS